MFGNQVNHFEMVKKLHKVDYYYFFSQHEIIFINIIYKTCWTHSKNLAAIFFLGYCVYTLPSKLPNWVSISPDGLYGHTQDRNRNVLLH